MEHNNKIIKIVVNLITTSRFLFSFFLMALINKIESRFFVILLITLFLSDFLDGYLARKFGVQTLYGSIMDVVADKVLSILLIIPLLGNIKIFFLLLIGDILIALLNVIGKLRQKHTCSSKLGKLKMWLLAITIILGYFHYYGYITVFFVFICVIVTFCLQMYVMYEYILYFKKQVYKENKEKYVVKNYNDLIYILFNTKYFLENIKSLD